MDIRELTSLIHGITRTLDTSNAQMKELSDKSLSPKDSLVFLEKTELIAPLHAELMFVREQLIATRKELADKHNRRHPFKKIKF